MIYFNYEGTKIKCPLNNTISVGHLAEDRMDTDIAYLGGFLSVESMRQRHVVHDKG